MGPEKEGPGRNRGLCVLRRPVWGRKKRDQVTIVVCVCLTRPVWGRKKRDQVTIVVCVFDKAGMGPEKEGPGHNRGLCVFEKAYGAGKRGARVEPERS